MPLLGTIGKVLQGVAGYALPFLGQSMQAKENMKLAQFQAQANERYLREMQAYNSPLAQMNRYKEAGLNPMLMYGQGNPGNQSAPLTHPDVKPRDFSLMFQNLMQKQAMDNQTKLAESQVSAQAARTAKDVVATEVSKVQKAILQRNPYLDDNYFNAMVESLKATAKLKAANAGVAAMAYEWSSQYKGRVQKDGSMLVQPEAFHKMDAELNMLFQKYHLNEADQKLKAAVLENKNFQNDLNEIQVKWMKDGALNPQLIYMLILKLISKF